MQGGLEGTLFLQRVVIMRKKSRPIFKLRVPTAPPTKAFKDKKKYRRKTKHKEEEE